MKREKIIKVKPRNVNEVCRFLDENYFHAGYGGDLNVTNKLYHNGISFRTIENHFQKNFQVKYEIIIKNQRNFDKNSLNKLIEIARN